MKKTALYEKLVERGAKIVDFHGYLLPMNFGGGILSERNAVREDVGLFEISHMGQIFVEGEDACEKLNKLLTNDISKLSVGQICYSLMLNEKGGVIDDLLAYRLDTDKFLFVVNVASKVPSIINYPLSINSSMLAIQGENSALILSRYFNLPKKYFTFLEIDGVLISRTGYTGEDGFEIIAKHKKILEIFDNLTDIEGVTLCGLGARDMLRIEAGLVLYGNEMDENTLATELSLDKFIALEKDDFVGKKALSSQKPQKRRVNLKLLERGVARVGDKVFADGKEVGTVTSGTLGYAIAKINYQLSIINSYEIAVRGRLIKAEEYTWKRSI
jgi:aminomethyltransferase